MKCKDFELCGNEHDDRYTMDFTDVEPGAYIYWCSVCGPIWHEVDKTLQQKLKTEPGFEEKFRAEVNKHYN